VSRTDSSIIDPNLVVIRFARTMGYGLFSIKVLILTEAQEALTVASSNFFARSILFLSVSGKKKQLHVVNVHTAEIRL